MVASAPELVLACVVLPVTTEQFTPPPLEAYTFMFGFTQPRSRGAIRLASADPQAAPLIDPNYLAEAYDREVYLEALAAAQAVGGAAAMAAWRAAEILPGPAIESRKERLAFLEKAAFTASSPRGQLPHGEDDQAVVGPDLRLHGIEGLHVCDASVMPSITTGPVNAAVIAIAERASDLLRGRPPLPPLELPGQAAEMPRRRLALAILALLGGGAAWADEPAADDRALQLSLANAGAVPLHCRLMFGHWVEQDLGLLAPGGSIGLAISQAAHDGALYILRADGQRRMMIEPYSAGATGSERATGRSISPRPAAPGLAASRRAALCRRRAVAWPPAAAAGELKAREARHRCRPGWVTIADARQSPGQSAVITCILNGSAGSNGAQEAREQIADLFARHGGEARVVLARNGSELAELRTRRWRREPAGGGRWRRRHPQRGRVGAGGQQERAGHPAPGHAQPPRQG